MKKRNRAVNKRRQHRHDAAAPMLSPGVYNEISLIIAAAWPTARSYEGREVEHAERGSRLQA